MSGIISAAAIGVGGSLLAAKGSKDAAKSAAAGQVEAANIAAEESRPSYFDLNTLFGNVDWTLDENGKPTGVNVDPGQFVQGLMGDAGANYDNYYNLLAQYFQPNLASGAGQIYNEWQNLLAPTRQTQQANLFSNLQNKGITGIEGYDPMTGAAVNPMMQGLFSGWAGQDQQMASESFNEYINRLAQLSSGTTLAQGNLIGVGSLPYEKALGLSSNLATRAANPAGGSFLQAGLSGAAQTQAQGALASAGYKNDFWQGLAGGLSGLTSSTQPAAPITTGSPWTPAPTQQQSMLDAQWNPNW